MSDTSVTEVLSAKSPTLASAVFGSSPRPRRLSTPRSPSGSISQPQTPSRPGKSLPSVPVPGSRSSRSTGTKKPPPRADSPDVETMIRRTPRPRRTSSATFSSPMAMARTRSNSSMAVPSSWKGVKKQEDDNESIISDYGALLEKDDSMDEKLLEGDGSESDSSIDIHTPLPHLMFRDGLLSPRSKLLPGGGSATLSLYLDDDDPAASVNRANSVLSVASTAGSTMTKSGIYRDPRDTARRRVRHRDQGLLRAGMGLTTGLGWSDSEDEDAPSLLTRRLINSNIERQPSMYSSSSRAPSQLSKSISSGNLSRAPTSYSPAPLTSRRLSRSMSSTFSHNRVSSADADSVTSVESPKPAARSRTQSNASASSVVSSGSRESSNAAQSVASSQSAQVRTGVVPRPLRLPQTAGIQSSVTRTTSMSESRPPASLSSSSSSSKAAKLARSSSTMAKSRTRTVSNPGSRPGITTTSALPGRPTAASRVVPLRSVSTAVMAPVRSMSVSALSPMERSSIASSDTLSEFPLPPSLTSSLSASAGLPSPSASASMYKHAQKPSIGSTSALVSTRAQVGLRPPRTGTGMVYRNSSYSSFYETSRTSRASVVSSGKEVGVI